MVGTQPFKSRGWSSRRHRTPVAQSSLWRDLLAVLSPSTRSLGPIFLDQLQGAVIGAPLPLGQSLMLAWPQGVALIAATIVLFLAGYVVFQRQEVRA